MFNYLFTPSTQKAVKKEDISCLRTIGGPVGQFRASLPHLSGARNDAWECPLQRTSLCDLASELVVQWKIKAPVSDERNYY